MFKHSIMDMLKQLGMAALYASLLYIGESHFKNGTPVGYFEPASGLALAVLLIGGKRYAWGVFLGAVLIHTTTGDSLWESVTIASGDTLQALCGAWLLTRDGKFDLRLQSLRDYLRLILLGGCASITIGALAANTTLLVSGLLAPANYSHSLVQWWMGDTLGVILIAPLILAWLGIRKDWRTAGMMAEATLILGLAILACQAIFLGWWPNNIGIEAKGYWMFLIVTWVAVRIGACGTTVVLTMTAIYALLGAIHGVGYFANDIAQTHLVNYWLYTVILSVVGMALATHFTERKQIEDALRESQARQSAILNNSPYLAWLKDTEGRYLKVNKAYADYARLKDAQQVIGKTDFDLWPKDLAEKYRTDDADVMVSRQQKRVEEPSLDGGKMHWVETFKTPVIDQSGNLLGTTGFARDITERKQAEQTLAESESRFREIFNTVSDAIFIHDAATGRIIDVNRRMCEMYGLTREEALACGPDDLSAGTPPYSSAEATEKIHLAHTDGPQMFEWLARARDGHLFWVEVSLRFASICGKQRILATVRDITERKQAEVLIRNLAFYDALTQLPNRRLLNDRLGQSIAASKRSGHYGVLMFLDLDNFKPLNDTHGHGVGDLLLIEVANRLAGCVREVDTVARFGGDEFVVMLGELDADKAESTAQAGIIAEKIRTALAEPYLLKIQQEGKAETTVEHYCAASIGVVVFNSEAGAEDIIKWADTAMYQAKERGRNQVHFFDLKP